MVILPLTMQSRRMLKRNLVYTAVTRAKKFLIMIGEPAAFELAVQTLAANRNTGLKKRLCSAFSIEEPVAVDDSQPTTEAPVEMTPSETGASTTEAETDDETTAAPNNEPEEAILTADMVLHGTIDPLIGMHGVKPADFENKQ